MITHKHYLETEKEYNLDNLMEYGERCLVENRHRNKYEILIHGYGWLRYGEILLCERQVSGDWDTNLVQSPRRHTT